MAHCVTRTAKFEVFLRASPDAVHDVRRDFERWLRDMGVDPETRDELTVVLSELVTNAIGASQGAGREVEVVAWVENGTVVLCVANPITPSSARVTPHDLDDPLRTGGRGLLIVRAFTDGMDVELDDGCIVVRCERSIQD